MKGASQIAPLGVRLPDELKLKVQTRASKNGRSMNAEIVSIIERSFSEDVERTHDVTQRILNHLQQIIELKNQIISSQESSISSQRKTINSMERTIKTLEEHITLLLIQLKRVMKAEEYAKMTDHKNPN